MLSSTIRVSIAKDSLSGLSTSLTHRILTTNERRP